MTLHDFVIPGAQVKIAKGNSKLMKTSGEGVRVVGYGIPADYNAVIGMQHIQTCRGANACKAYCYAKQGRYTMPNVFDARLANLVASVSADFVEKTVEALLASKADIVRVHDSGDFYSQVYLEKWFMIARHLPEMTFYAYTKSLDLDLYSLKPKNFQLVQSLGGRFDDKVDLNQPHSRVFATHEARERHEYVDGSESDWPAINGEIRIGLVYHGTKKLTLPQIKHLS